MTDNGFANIKETAMEYRRLDLWGWTPKQIAAEYRTSITKVIKFLKLASANSDVLTLLREGSVTTELAILVISVNGDRAGEALQRLRLTDGPRGVANQ